MDVNEIAQTVRDKLKKFEDFQGLYLYGSRVKGGYRPESDIDIVALFSQEPDYSKNMDIIGEVLDVELENDAIIDFHPMTQEGLKLNYLYFEEVKKGIFYGL